MSHMLTEETTQLRRLGIKTHITTNMNGYKKLSRKTDPLQNLKMSIWPGDIISLISKQDLQWILSWGNTWDEHEKSQHKPESPARPWPSKGQPFSPAAPGSSSSCCCYKRTQELALAQDYSGIAGQARGQSWLGSSCQGHVTSM